MPKLLLLIFFVSLTAQAAGSGVSVDDSWLTVRDISLEIKAGSPLDFSGVFSEHSGPVTSRVEQNQNGEFLVSGKPVRFLCAPMNLTPPYGGFPSHEIADRLALQLKRSGYNLVRIVHVESTLMTNRLGDFDYDPQQLDNFFYFLAALKKQGIYWLLDAMTSENGAYGNVLPHRWVNRHNLKARIHVDVVAQAHWRKLVETLLSRVNPYTGQKIILDDALLGLSLVNEGTLQFLTHIGRKIPSELVMPFQKWLQGKYRFQKEKFEDIWQQPFTHLLTDVFRLPTHDERSARMDDLLTYYDETQGNTAKWMGDYLHSLGYKGRYTAYNNLSTTHAIRSRRIFPWVDMHSYHDEAFGFEAGSKLKNISSFDAGLKYITDLSMSRLGGRSFTVSEFGHPFWNQWRRESALLFPSYASFQNWDAICQHASTAVDLTYAHASGWKQSLIPYAIGLDPVGRVVEILSALLYRRKDVAPGSQLLEVEFPSSNEDRNMRYWGVSPQLARVSLVSRVHTKLHDDSKQTNSSKIKAVGDSRVAGKIKEIWGKLGINVNINDSDVIIDGISKRENPDSRTKSSLGIYESSSKELLARFKERRFEVITERTRGIVFDKLIEPWSLGPLKLVSADKPSLVVLSSLDGLELAMSKRMLLILASDALNTGMRFDDEKRRELRAIGRLPVRIDPRKFGFEFPVNSNIKVSALKLNGDISEVLPIVRGNGAGNLEIDFSSLKSGPTFYFYLERIDG